MRQFAELLRGFILIDGKHVIDELFSEAEN